MQARGSRRAGCAGRRQIRFAITRFAAAQEQRSQRQRRSTRSCTAGPGRLHPALRRRRRLWLAVDSTPLEKASARDVRCGYVKQGQAGAETTLRGGRCTVAPGPGHEKIDGTAATAARARPRCGGRDYRRRADRPDTGVPDGPTQFPIGHAHDTRTRSLLCEEGRVEVGG